MPIEFVERERGDSKMSGAVATESLKRITAWGLRERARAAAPRAASGVTRPMSRDPPRRRWVAAAAAVVAFVVMPLVEIYVLIQVGQVIGAWWTILLLVARQHRRRLADQARGRPAWQALRDGARARPDAGQASSPTAR